MQCPQCHTKNAETRKFCGECGASLVLVCSQCSYENMPSDKFCGKCGQRLEKRAETQKAVPASEGERKHATVLFSDLSGYTAMTERLDPEDVKEIMSEIFGKIEQVVTKYEGLVERFFGDEVMVLFGVPKAHEDDPVRAVKAAMEIQDVVKGMSPEFEDRIGQPLAMHTGINTGLVVTGDEYIGKGRHGLTGDTVNLAARLTKLAQPGEAIVGPDTYSQAQGYFTFERLQPTQVKGKEKAVRAYKALSPKEDPTKVHRAHGVRAELIGRQEEMVQLAEGVERLRQGEGTIISVCGDAGTGKSRLIDEFKATLNMEQIQWREGHAYAYCQNVPYFPLVDMLSRAWDIEEGDPPDTVKDKIESNIAYLLGERDDAVPYVGSLYALEYPEIEGVDPEFWKIRLHQTIREILSALAQRAPTVICLEDIHWADPSSLEFLRSILSEFTYPALFLLVYRPHFSLFHDPQVHTLEKSYREIRLEDLSASEAQKMTASLLKSKAIPSDLQRFVQERVEGNPFYLEEVINSLIESKTLIRDNGNWKLTRSMSEASISPTIHGVISGRLDRLDKEAKRILQEASVIGRAFFYEILKRITELKEHIDQCLSGLERLDLIRTRSLQPELEYIFKHALTQEVVYEGLLKAERQAIHERIGLVMEKLFHDRLSEFYESLAFHFKQGLSILKAVHYLMKSGEKSQKRYAVEESHQYYKDAFDLLTAKPNRSKEEESLLIDLLTEWAHAFNYRGDWRGLDDLLRSHVTIAESLDDKGKLGMFHGWLGIAAHCREKYRNAYQYLSRALKLGEEAHNQQVIGYACSWLTWVCAELGLLKESVGYGQRAQEIAELLPSDQKSHFQFHALNGLGYVYWQKGNKKKALEYGKALIDYGQRNSNMQSLVWGHWIMGVCHILDGDLPSAIQYSKQGIEISEHPWFSQMLKMTVGGIYVYQGHFDEAESPLREVVTYSEKFGGEGMGTPAKMYLGAALIGKGHMAQGLKMVEEAQGLFLENERKGLYAISEYILGKVYLQIAERSAPMTLLTMAKNIGFLVKNVPFAGRKAEAHFKKAIEIAEEIGAKGSLGQVYLDFGLLHKAKGRLDEARQCITKSIELFEECETEGYLQQAKEALESLD